MEKDLKNFFANLIAKRNEEIGDCEKQLKALDEQNDQAKDEEELKAIGDNAETLKAKIEALKKELADAEAQLADLDKPAGETDPKPMDDMGDGKERALKNMNGREERKMNIQEREERAKKFKDTKRMSFENKEVRSTLISGGHLATPTEVGGINDLENQVSSIVDMVNVVDCEGMGAYKVAYEKALSTATQQTEGSAITSSDPEFDFVTISPASYGVISYISKQVEKQTALNYQEKISKSAKDALRIKANDVITTAIKASALNVTLDATVTSGVGVVDEKTLRKIALNYGGNLNVEGNAVLFLNKTDLIAFGDVRGSNEKKAVYEITPDSSNPNTGVIKDGGLSVKYVINDKCTACAGTAQTTSAIKTMFYGNPKCFELGLFSDYAIEVSSDYKFAENMLSIRGDVELGGDVTYQNGFVVLTIPASE